MRKAILLGAVAAFAVGCTTNPYTGERRASRTVTSGAGGAAAGAAAGALIGAFTGNAGKGAWIGAASGAAIGTGIGVYQERQADKLEAQLRNSGVSVTREGDNIYLNMPADVTFDTARSDIKPAFYDVLNSVALVLNEYDKTTVSIYGHADARGNEQDNLVLSRDRADSVARYLVAQRVDSRRLYTSGFGETRLLDPGNSAAAHARNRRVEIVIDPVDSAFAEY